MPRYGKRGQNQYSGIRFSVERNEEDGVGDKRN